MHPRLMEALTKENPQTDQPQPQPQQQQQTLNTQIKEKQLNTIDLSKVTSSSSSSSLQPNAKRIKSILNETTSGGTSSNRIKLESNDAEKLIRLIKQNNNNTNNNNNSSSMSTNVNSNVVFSPRLAFLTKINSCSSTSTALPLATHNENTSNTINNNNIIPAITQIQNNKQQQQQNENQQKTSNQNVQNLFNVKYNESKTIVRTCPTSNSNQQQPAPHFKTDPGLPYINESLKLLSPSHTPSSTPTTPNFPQSHACIDESPGIKHEPEPLKTLPALTTTTTATTTTSTTTRSTRISVKTNSNQNQNNNNNNNEYSSSLTTSSSKRQKISNNLIAPTQAPIAPSNPTRKPFACLRNLGSTCYINCIIQVMRYTPGFVLSIHRLNKQIDYLKTLNCDIENEIDRNSDITFVRNLHELLVEMSEKEKLDRRPIYTPRKFVNTVWSSLSFWSDGSQQDAHEFLQYTIHFINECDMFIRKLQQKYQLKNLPLMWDSSTNANSNCTKNNTTTTTAGSTCDPQQDKFKKPASLSNTNKVKYKSASNLSDININIINEEDSSSSTSSTSSSCSSTSTSSGSMCSLRLIKSVPKIHDGASSPAVNDYMRTPTKGGASVYNNNATMMDDCLAPTNSANNQPESMLKPQAAAGREPIKVKLQLDSKNGAENSYKIVSLTGLNGDSSLSSSSDNDKDLVSKLLKSVTNTSTTITNLNVNKPTKRVRRPDEVKYQPSVPPNDLDDDSSVIIIDSTDDEDDYVQVETPATPVAEKPEPPPNIEVEPAQEAKVMPVNEEQEIKKCYVLLERIDMEKYKTQAARPNNAETKKRIRPKNVKFRSKSKTFPPLATSPSPTPTLTPTPTPTPTTTNEIFDLDAIMPLSSLTDSGSVSTGTNNTSCARQTKSTRSSNMKATATKVVAEPIKPNMMAESPATTSLPVGSTSAPPSPAELLRKYSTSVGYVCEMDKLFKGSSVTVTQCLECENLRKCPEAFYDRSIPIDTTTTNAGPDDEEDDKNNGGWISKCLSNESYLNENSKYMCDICSSKQEARIHTQYTQMPNILVLHLLSYGITSSVDGNLNAQKISNRSRLVNYFDFLVSKETPVVQSSSAGEKDPQSAFKSPITTRRQSQLQQQQQQQQQMNQQQSSTASSAVDSTYKHQFKLFAVVMHSGVSLNSGHYTAFINYRIISQRENNIESLKKLNLKNEKPCSCLIDCKMDDLPSSTTTPTGTHSTTSAASTNANQTRHSKFNYATAGSSEASTTKTTASDSSANKQSNNQPEWLHFDDTKVKSMSSLEFHRKIIDSSYDSPYILFYVKD